MDQLPILFHFESKPIRVITDANGLSWFVAPDICRVLDLAHVASALRVLDADEKGVRDLHTPGGPQQVSVISEPGLYKLMARSRKPEARRFDRWVRHEVLPAIRKTGGYNALPAPMSDDELMARSILIASRKIEQLTAQVSEMQPKVDAFVRIAESDGSYCITDAAKTLQMRPKDLFTFMRAEAWIHTRGGSTVPIAYQNRIQAGLLEHKTTTVSRSDGTEKSVSQVRVTPRGLAKLAEHFTQQ